MKLLGYALAFVLAGFQAKAGPDASSTYLMDAPVSLMDLGVLKMNLLLEKKVGGYASYDWDSNKIRIGAPYEVQFISLPSLEIAEAACAKWISDVKGAFSVDAETGKVIFFEHSTAAGFFAHDGFERKNTPETLYSDIDNMIVLNCYAGDGTDRISTSSPLLAKGYSLTKP